MTEPSFITNGPRSGETEEQTAARYNRPRDPLLVEREKTHGSYLEHATMTQDLKKTMKEGKNWKNLSSRHKESLEMIQHKIGRILGGNPEFKDHWDDIAGYAKLASEACD